MKKKPTNPTYDPPAGTVYLVKSTGKRTHLSEGAVAIKTDPATGSALEIA